MTAEQAYDAIVIGAGQAGVPLSTALSGAGWRMALVEREQVGGTCINRGCTPTKTMVASARVAHVARQAAEYGVQTGQVTVDMARVRQRKRDMVDSFRGGSQRRIEQAENVDLLMGEARFVGHKALEVHFGDGRVHRLAADTVVINTGSRPRRPELPGPDEVPCVDSTSIMELDEVPRHLLVLGGGYVGVEFAQMFRRFGSTVTLIQRDEQLLSQEDADVAEEVAAMLREDGIEILLSSEARRAGLDEEGGVRLAVRTPEGERLINGSHLLIAAGRVPNTEQLNLVACGVATDRRGAIKVDERLETNVPGVYAVGDVNGGPAFTHISYDDYRVLRANLLQDGEATTTGRLLPYTVFTDPQLGRVGLTERQAREQGRRYRVARMPMAHVARALEVGESRGLMKAVVDAESDQILGAAILGYQGGEIAAIVQVALMGGLPYTALRDGIFAHPTLSESLNNLFMSFEEER